MTRYADRKPIDVAFVGCGAAAKMHGRILRNLGGAARCWFASRDIARADEYRRRLGGEGSFGTYQSAIDDPRIDVVFITTPPVSHLDLVMTSLRAGKDVIVEKPAFLRSSDFDLVQQVERETGRRVFVAENYFYKPLARMLRQLIGAGTIGDVLFVQINALKTQRVSDWRTDPASAGGGALFEGGIHWLDFMNSIGLEIAEVQALRAGVGRGAGESMLVSISYRDGAVGSLAYSWTTPSMPGGLQLSRVSGSSGFIVFESNGLFAIVVAGRRSRVAFPGFVDITGRRAMLKDFLGALKADRSPSFTLDRARRDIELTERCYGSADAFNRIATPVATLLPQRANAG